MYLRTLIFLLLLAGGVIPSFAFNGRNNFQDSVKRVTITITASEKPRSLNLDSLLNDSQTTTERAEQKYSNRSLSNDDKKGTSANKENTSTQAISKLAETSQKSTPKADQNKVASKIPQAIDNKPALADHHEQIEEEQIISDSMVVDESNTKASRTYLWVGFMLIVVGVILGILFGKTALLISIAGVVFVTIGYLINH